MIQILTLKDSIRNKSSVDSETWFINKASQNGNKKNETLGPFKMLKNPFKDVIFTPLYFSIQCYYS